MSKEEKKKDTSEDFEGLKLPPKPKSEDEEELEELKPIEEIEPEPKPQQTGFVWTAEILKDIEVCITNLADKYLTHKKNNAEAQKNYFEAVSKHNRRMVYVLLGFLIGIAAFMSLLTWYGSVSGDALLFLVGTITGYALLFIQRLVFPSKETPPTEEDIITP